MSYLSERIEFRKLCKFPAPAAYILINHNVLFTNFLVECVPVRIKTVKDAS